MLTFHHRHADIVRGDWVDPDAGKITFGECLVWTAAASGLRFGELAGLSVDHVNLDRSELRGSRALNDIKGVGPTLGPPKTGCAVRTVAIPEAITLRLVVDVDQYVDDAKSDSLVFTSLRGGPLLNTYFAPRWAKDSELSGVGRGLSPFPADYLARGCGYNGGRNDREVDP